jgi:hypothetical protein
MLQEIVRLVDTSGDGKIQYEGSYCITYDPLLRRLFPLMPSPLAQSFAYLLKPQSGSSFCYSNQSTEITTGG